MYEEETRGTSYEPLHVSRQRRIATIAVRQAPKGRRHPAGTLTQPPGSRHGPTLGSDDPRGDSRPKSRSRQHVPVCMRPPSPLQPQSGTPEEPRPGCGTLKASPEGQRSTAVCSGEDVCAGPTPQPQSASTLLRNTVGFSRRAAVYIGLWWSGLARHTQPWPEAVDRGRWRRRAVEDAGRATPRRPCYRAESV